MFVTGDMKLKVVKKRMERIFEEKLWEENYYAPLDWERVWSNFCLAFENENKEKLRLLDDMLTLKDYGISKRNSEIRFSHYKNNNTNHSKARKYRY